MKAKKIRHIVIGLAKTKRHRSFHAVYDTVELFFGKCDITGVGGVGVIVKMSLTMNFDSFKMLSLSIVVYVLASSYDENEVETLHVDLEKSSENATHS